MSDRDRSDDSWRKEDADKERGEVLLYRLHDGPMNTALDELMAFAQPKGWRWISLNIARPGDDAPFPGAEKYAEALDDLIEVARGHRRALGDYTEAPDADDLPFGYELDQAADRATAAWEELNRSLDER